jgi:cytochrome c oxidase subunit 2
MARRHWLRVALGASVAVFGALWFGTGRSRAAAQERVRTVEVTARRYAFAPDTIEVGQDELLRVVFTAEDVPHSFTIDEYRIAKRAEPGRPVRFEFRADRAGRFTYYCNLKSDDGCRDMRGTLVVHPR